MNAHVHAVASGEREKTDLRSWAYIKYEAMKSYLLPEHKWMHICSHSSKWRKGKPYLGSWSCIEYEAVKSDLHAKHKWMHMFTE